MTVFTHEIRLTCVVFDKLRDVAENLVLCGTVDVNLTVVIDPDHIMSDLHPTPFMLAPKRNSQAARYTE